MKFTMVLKQETIKKKKAVLGEMLLLWHPYSQIPILLFYPPIFLPFLVGNQFFGFLVYPFCISFADM